MCSNNERPVLCRVLASDWLVVKSDQTYKWSMREGCGEVQEGCGEMGEGCEEVWEGCGEGFHPSWANSQIIRPEDLIFWGKFRNFLPKNHFPPTINQVPLTYNHLLLSVFLIKYWTNSVKFGHQVIILLQRIICHLWSFPFSHFSKFNKMLLYRTFLRSCLY